MKPIFAALPSLHDLIVDSVQVVWGWLRDGITSVSTVEVNALFSTVHSAVPSFDVSTWTAYWNNIDYIFPLHETLVMAQALFVLYIAVFLFRLAKSFIPTVAT